MAVYNRPFAHHDFEKMWHFLERDYAYRQDHFVWQPSRLGDWMYGLWNEKKYIPLFFRNHAQLWLNDFDELLGFVLSENGDEVIYIFTAHGYDYLYAEILEWTIQHWQPRYPTLKTEVHEYQTEALAQLARSGFCNSGVVATTRAYDLRADRDDTPHLSPLYHIEDMCTNGDWMSKALLLANGFGGQDGVSDFELLRYAYSRENPAYDPAFDLSVLTADGVHVSGCVGFCDAPNATAEVEKVCTHNQYRRQGLGEAVIRACFQRLRARGIRRAYITGYSTEANGLYEKLGPCWSKKWYHYVLGVSAGVG
jgi:ribosomal protein S18 acetylase RimI-like enzyme